MLINLPAHKLAPFANDAATLITWAKANGGDPVFLDSLEAFRKQALAQSNTPRTQLLIAFEVMRRLAGEDLTAWEGEEESVKQEKAGHIKALNKLHKAITAHRENFRLDKAGLPGGLDFAPGAAEPDRMLEFSAIATGLMAWAKDHGGSPAYLARLKHLQTMGKMQHQTEQRTLVKMIERIQSALEESWAKWDDEEDSVKEEHQELIDDLRQKLNDSYMVLSRLGYADIVPESLAEVMRATGTEAGQWEVIEGLRTGVGVEHHYRNVYTGQTAYVCVDQGEVITCEIHNAPADDEQSSPTL